MCSDCPVLASPYATRRISCRAIDLVGHLRRIGCQVEASWPIPDSVATADVLVLSIDHESRAPIQRLCRSFNGVKPTMIAVVGYEDPSILQIVLDAGVHGVIERPVRSSRATSNSRRGIQRRATSTALRFPRASLTKPVEPSGHAALVLAVTLTRKPASSTSLWVR